MIKDELFRRLKLCYSGNKKAYDELVLFILNYKPPYTSEYAEKLEETIKEAIEKLNLLMLDLKINEKAEEQEGKSYFNTQLFTIRVKGILETLESTDK